jgi:integrase/recombinase XerD
MDALICRGFEQYLEHEKHLSGNTRSSYICDLHQFQRWLVMHDLSHIEVTSDDVSNYIDTLREEGKAASTLARTMAALKSFYGYLFHDLKVDRNPVSGLSLERAKRQLPKVLTGGEMELFLGHIYDEDFKGMRDRAMLELLYATGIRVSELVALDISDVDISGRALSCRGKAGSRIIPIYAAAAVALGHYISDARPHMLDESADDALFLNVNGHRMSRQGFWKIVKSYQDKAGIHKDITPHTLRHSFAAHLLENGADIHSLKEMLGHADIASTQVYQKLVNSQITDVYNRSHPRAAAG